MGKKRKRKEYNNKGELIFEGEYKYGWRYNGKGKEYNYEYELIFEGEYENGIKWNGKSYNYNYDNFKLEQEYINGNLIIEKLYNSDGNLLSDTKNGLTKEYYYNDKLKY